MKRAFNHFAVVRFWVEGGLESVKIGVRVVGCGRDERIMEFGWLEWRLFVVLEVGGSVVGGFGWVEDVGAGDEAFGVGVGDEVGQVVIVVLVQGGIVGIEAVFLGVVEGNAAGLGRRPASLELVVHPNYNQ